MSTHVMRLVDEQVQRARLIQEAARAAGREPELPHGPTIVISRQLGSGGKFVAEKVAERLGYVLWDKNLIDAIATDAYVSRRIVEAFDEKTVSEIEVLARTIAGQSEVGGFMFRRHLVRALLAIARHGDAVIVGRGANFALPEALSVRVMGTEEYRIQSMVEHEGVTADQARKMIHESDHQRAEFVRNVYGRDIDDIHAYDLIAIIDCFGIEGVTDLVVTALNARRDGCWRARHLAGSKSQHASTHGA